MRKTVTTAGTVEQLGPPVVAQAFYVTALPGNSGTISISYEPKRRLPLAKDIGDEVFEDGPAAGSGSEDGIILEASESITLPGPRLDTYWVDAEVSGEGVAIFPIFGEHRDPSLRP